MAAPAEGSSELTRRSPEHLCSELQSAWSTIADLTTRQSEVSSPLHGKGLAAASLRDASEQYEEVTQSLLRDPIEQFLRVRPTERSLEAIREFDHDADHFAVHARRRIDSRFQALLAKASLDLCEPWRIWRSGGSTEEWDTWDRQRASHFAQASRLLADYSRWAGKQAERAAINSVQDFTSGPNDGVQGFKSGVANRIQGVRNAVTNRIQGFRTAATNRVQGFRKSVNNRLQSLRKGDFWKTWRHRQKTVVTLLEAELTICALGRIWLREINELTKGLRLERQTIVSTIEKTVVLIEQGSGEGILAPVEGLELATAEERLRSWSRAFEKEADRGLPDRLDLPKQTVRLSRAAPLVRQTILNAFAETTAASVRRTVERYCEQSSALMREAGRAGEIINYWRIAAANRADSGALLAEAKHNAHTLLLDQLPIGRASDDLDSQLAEAFRQWLESGASALERLELGLVTLLRRPRGQRMLVRRLRATGQAGQRTLHRAGRWTHTGWERILESVGGKLPSHSVAVPVVRRATLRDTLSLPASKGELPALYGSLFRLAPVDDRRFLIGRDQELAGLKQAFKDWDSGRFAACLFIGARGSGKTSLLNCAATSAFAGSKLIRTQFVKRALDKDMIDDFLRNLLELDQHADLAAAFAAERRVVMIEESERIYLRKVGGFQGAKHLLSWIHRTASTTLWLIVMNDRAFRVLDAGVQFGSAFSHRINAMSVSRTDLENAILQRHRLSGLRLEFAPPPAGDPRVNRAKRLIGLEESPQALFFDSLYQQSGGIFRSAFELWLSSVEQVQGEMLKIRQPLEPSFGNFRRELTQDDHFSLLAIHEHGSLTDAEMTELLCDEDDLTHRRMSRLMALGLIEPDPEHMGFRLCPEAQRFTNDLLRRVNLT